MLRPTPLYLILAKNTTFQIFNYKGGIELKKLLPKKFKAIKFTFLFNIV